MKKKVFKKTIIKFTEGRSGFPAAALIAIVSAACFLASALTAGALGRRGTAEYRSGRSFDILIEAPLLLTGDELSMIRATKGVKAAEPLPEDAENGFNFARVTVSGSDNASLFGSSYRSRVDAVSRRLRALAEERSNQRREEVRSELTGRIAELSAQTEADSAELELLKAALALAEAAIPELEANISEIEDLLKKNETELADSRKRLSQTESELINSRQALDPDSADLEREKAELDAEQASLSQTRAGLAARWNSLENDKERFRETLRQAIADIGGEPEFIDWASKKSARPDEADVHAIDFWLTPDYSFDLNNTLAENVKGLIYSGQIPDGDLLDLTASMGVYHGSDVDTARSLLSFGVGLAVSGHESEHTRLRETALAWDADHAVYSAALADYLARRSDFNTRITQYRSGEQDYVRKLAAYKNELEAYNNALHLRDDTETKLLQRRDDLAELNAAVGRDSALYDTLTARYAENRGLIIEAEEGLESLPEGTWLITDRTENADYKRDLGKYDLLRAVSAVSGCVCVIALTLAGLCIAKKRGEV